MYNPRPGSLYVHLDQILFDLKYDPSIIEIPVPRYFRQDDQLPVDIKFTEPVLKDKPKKKKKKKKKAKKKSKKTEEVKLPPPLTFAQKEFMLDEEYKKAHNCTDAEVEIIHDTHSWNMDIEMAIRVIQRNERGRQGRGRIMLFLKRMKDDALQEKKKQLARMQKTESAN